jgi:DNA (cytosine-5)-methyltransferase 1
MVNIDLHENPMNMLPGDKLSRQISRSNPFVPLSAISLFSGAGGMDVGFIQAGFNIFWANDFDKHAADTYSHNIGTHMVLGDIGDHLADLAQFSGVDCVFGGPPCQGFSVAGKMDLEDPRSELVLRFLEAIEIVRPRSFVMENVKALASLSKFSDIRAHLIQRSIKLGYRTELVVLNSKNFSVPQARERMFLIGVLGDHELKIESRISNYHTPEISTKSAIGFLGPQNTEVNPKTCNAMVTIAEHPVLRKSPYAGMLFNGLGRPLNPAAPCATLPASMGGNKTPIIDERQYYGDGESWVEQYHIHLLEGGAPYGMNDAPEFLRRLTLTEARILHTFPEHFEFRGAKSTVYRQIGNAVPCNLAKAVARTLVDVLADEPVPVADDSQLEMSLASVG